MGYHRTKECTTNEEGICYCFSLNSSLTINEAPSSTTDYICKFKKTHLGIYCNLKVLSRNIIVMVGFYHIVSQFQGIVGDSVPYLNVLSRILFALGILCYRPPAHTHTHTHTPKRTQTIKTLTSQTRTQINTYDSSMIKRKKTCQTLNMILLQRHDM